MQDENTKHSGARLTSLLTVFAVLVCMLSLLVFPASAASEPTAEQFYGVWTIRPDCANNLPSASFDFSGVRFLLNGKVNDYLQYNGQYQAFQSNTWASTTMNGDEVFDFGKTPVEIPEALYEFFVENFEYSSSSYVKITAHGGQENYTLLDGAGSLFRMATGFIGNIGQTILNTPLLLAFIALPVVGLGVGLFNRLRGV